MRFDQNGRPKIEMFFEIFFFRKKKIKMVTIFAQTLVKKVFWKTLFNLKNDI
jgi:hypothetical protein